MDSRIELLVRLLDQAFDRKAWHGTTLRGSVRGLGAAEAAWRPAPERHSIAEIVIHAAYWKYAVRRKLSGAKRASFPLKGSNWFPVATALSEDEWRSAVRLLEDEHRQLREMVAAVPASHLREPAPGSKWRYDELIQGVAAHDLYHAGQIQLLKRLRGGR
jgi:uncharacterized damage-inducible protein DinB